MLRNIIFLSLCECASLVIFRYFLRARRGVEENLFVIHAMRVMQSGAGAMGCYPTRLFRCPGRTGGKRLKKAGKKIVNFYGFNSKQSS
jgi:hypothetical protein